MFSEKLKLLRKQKNITQEELATILNVSTGTIGNYESGTRRPQSAIVQRIASYFNVSVEYLLGDEMVSPQIIAFDTANTSPIIINKYYDSTFDLANTLPKTHEKILSVPILKNVNSLMLSKLHEQENVIDYIYIKRYTSASYIALKANDNAMNAARIAEGDTVIVRLQSKVEKNDIALVQVDSEPAILRFINQEGTLLQLIPQSYDRNYKITFYDITQHNIIVLGKVVESRITF